MGTEGRQATELTPSTCTANACPSRMVSGIFQWLTKLRLPLRF